MAEQTPDEGAQTEGAGAQFSLQRIFVKDLSFESPNAPEIFRSDFKPRVKLDLNSRAQRLADDLYEVVLTVSIDARNEDETPCYIVEVQQAGIFGIVGFEDQRMQHMLSSYCPSVLFPYAREAVDSLVLRGSFPPLMMSPVNFDALYTQALRQQQDAASTAGAAGAPAPAEAGDGDPTTH